MKSKFKLGMYTLLLCLFFSSGCTSNEILEPDHDHEHAAEATELILPEINPIETDGKLQVVVTTSIIGDIVSQIGGDFIDLTILIPAGQDSHSFEPTAQDLTAVSTAHLIFINGWDLEETLVHDLEEISETAPLIPISANITPLTVGDSHNADPHVWFDIHNVEQWVENVEHVLSDADPDNAEKYHQNTESYLSELAQLETSIKTQLDQIPAEDRRIVTNHDSFSYFASAYNFEIVGTVIPTASTLAEPSANEMAELITTMAEQDVCTIFTETAVSDSLAQTISDELEHCAQTNILTLYTGTLGTPNSGAGNYIGMFQTNVNIILNSLP